MSNDRTRLPLPPTRYLIGIEGDGYNEDRITSMDAWDDDAMHAYSDAENAALTEAQAYLMKNNKALREQVRVLREVVESAAAADVFKDSPGAMDRLAEYARAALKKTA